MKKTLLPINSPYHSLLNHKHLLKGQIKNKYNEEAWEDFQGGGGGAGMGVGRCMGEDGVILKGWGTQAGRRNDIKNTFFVSSSGR